MMDAQNKSSKPNVLASCLTLVTGIYLRVIALPRATVDFALHIIQLFESFMLSTVWEYQGDNILQFVLRHQFIQSGAVVITESYNISVGSGCQKAGSIRSQGVQTDDSENSGVFIDTNQQNDYKLPSNEEEANKNNTKPGITPELQFLTTGLNTIDNQIVHTLGLLDGAVADIGSAEKGPALSEDGLDAAKNVFEGDSLPYTIENQELTGINTVLAETTIHSQLVVKHDADAGVMISSLAVDYNNSVFSDFETKLTTPADQELSLDEKRSISIDENKFGSCEIVGNDRFINTEQGIVENYIGSSGSSASHVTMTIADKVSSDSTLKHVHYLDLEVVDGPQPKSANVDASAEPDTTAVGARSRKFSLKKEIKRRSWFGKKAALK